MENKRYGDLHRDFSLTRPLIRSRGIDPTKATLPIILEMVVVENKIEDSSLQKD